MNEYVQKLKSTDGERPKTGKKREAKSTNSSLSRLPGGNLEESSDLKSSLKSERKDGPPKRVSIGHEHEEEFPVNTQSYPPPN